MKLKKNTKKIRLVKNKIEKKNKKKQPPYFNE